MNLYGRAQRYVGEIFERPGGQHHPFILWCHESVSGGFDTDEIPWCSSFLNRLAWDLRLPRSKSAAARSWLLVGVPVKISEARPGDVVIVKRGADPQPGPEKINAPGHVFVFGGIEGEWILGVGGNQTNGVTVGRFPKKSLLGIRRLE